MNTLHTLINILVFGWIVRNILYWVTLWQVKEYRVDRMIIHLRETTQGRNLFFSPLALLKLLGIISYAFVIHKSTNLFYYEIFVLTIYLLEFLRTVSEAFTKTFKRPVLTFKAGLLIAATFFTLYGIYSFPLLETFLWIVLIDKITPFIISFLVLFLSFPTELYRDWKISKAAQKIAQHKRLLVIGITGSFGKSSTKEYISQVLQYSFRVVWTKGTNNTPIGIANTILNDLRKDTQLLVVEMGAYKKGEITQLCQIVKPKIGIITAVSNQHLSLFGSLINTMDTKYELIESLPKNGIAFFNVGNEKAYTLSKRITPESKIRKILYQRLDISVPFIPHKNTSSIVADNVVGGKTFVTFDAYATMLDIKTKKKILGLRAPLVGIHNVENILPAIFIAVYLGMTPQEIKKAVSSLVSVEKTMKIKKFPSGTVYIDDSYSTNPDAVIAVLKYLKSYKNESSGTARKVFVLHPMIELGKNAREEHYKIGQEIGSVCDYLFLTNKNFFSSIVHGVEDSVGECVVTVADTGSIAAFIRSNLSKDDVVVFEGRESGRVLAQVL